MKTYPGDLRGFPPAAELIGLLQLPTIACIYAIAPLHLQTFCIEL
jgi:hypothetical protein